MNANAKYVQVLGDAALPLIGFFWLGWNLYFIVIYYLLDLLVKEVVIHLKSRKIVEEKPTSTGWLKQGIGSAVLLVSTVVLIHCTMWAIHPNIQFLKEWSDFMAYADMGIPQGYIIIPLLAMMGYQQFRLEFVVLGKYRTTHLMALWKNHHTGFLLSIGAIAFTLGLTYWIILPDVVYLIGIVAFTSLFQVVRLYKVQNNPTR
jgi:hypothetical protein